MKTDWTLSKSERAIMSAIRFNGPITRSEVTALTNRSQQTVHRLIDQLVQKGLLKIGDPVVRGRGKPSPSVLVNTDKLVSIGASIGTEHLRCSVVDLAGGLLHEELLDTVPEDPSHVIEVLQKQVAIWSDKKRGSDNILGLGVSLQGYRTGPVDEFYPPDALAGWRGIPVSKTIEEACGLPTFVENDASSSVIAEYFHGDGSGHDPIAYLAFNFGFGGGILSKQSTVLGAHGNAGDISTIFTQDQIWHRPALGELLKRLRSGGIEINSLRELEETFDPEWEPLKEWLTEVQPMLQLALRAFKAVADPGAIFFGGDAPEGLRKLLIDVSEDAFRAQPSPDPLLLPSAIKGDAAHIGAAFLPLDRIVY